MLHSQSLICLLGVILSPWHGKNSAVWMDNSCLKWLELDVRQEVYRSLSTSRSDMTRLSISAMQLLTLFIQASPAPRHPFGYFARQILKCLSYTALQLPQSPSFWRASAGDFTCQISTNLQMMHSTKELISLFLRSTSKLEDTVLIKDV